ncbi:E4 SUMO-protein ligase PIAL2-like isoform X2 [Ipomoea triloba]|uniref:E4 SUMO-protein ligase PIAL2-like isoform X2 n=1 Tax=Ipomoea triloba TaxID=35885 RepID=UPI00125D8A7C|nr:E4 SUMO-protein ligase PIAL2-like isoform X2 [Ipomoea triloba]
MAGTAVNHPPVTPGAYAGGGGNAAKPPSVNSCSSISAIADRLARHACNQPLNDVVEFCKLCISLSKGINDAIASHEVPTKAPDLPVLLKQVCCHRNEPYALAAVMVLMVSAKNACSSGWFLDRDSKELHCLANEISSNFCSTTDFESACTGSSSMISTIMSRFLPQMRMGHILAFLEMKPGYGTLVYDFHISENTKSSSPEAEIRLLVAHLDNIETSSCLITPPNVNFLLNGKGVQNRNNLSMDTGPQIPTALSSMLNNGVNILQVVGQFNGSYIVVIASMSMTSTPDSAALPDYVQPESASVDPDYEIIEGPSRISLNCPISFKRIKTPAKGVSCKHLQCFDYENYLDINSRRPSWRCPHCNQHVCFPEIRIDQDMAKVLQEVGENINDVIISSDGSWKAIIEGDDDNQRPPDKPTDFSKDKTLQPDLTDIDDAMTGDHIASSSAKCQNQLLDTNNPSEANHTPNMENFWSRVLRSTYGSGTSSSMLNLHIGGASEPTPTSLMPPPILIDDHIPACVMGQGRVSSPNTMQAQQYQFANSAANQEHVMSSSAVRHAVCRTPVAVQALPAQMPYSVPQQRPVNTMSRLSSPTTASQHSPVSSMMNIDTVQQYLRSNSNMHQASQIPSSTSTSMPPGYSSGSVGPAQQFVNLQCPSQVPLPPFRAPSGFTTEPSNTNQHQTLNRQTLHAMSQPQGIAQPSPASFTRSPFQAGGTHSSVGGGQARGVVNSQHNNKSREAALRTAQVAKPVQLSPTLPPLSMNPNASRESLANDQMGVGNIGDHAPPDLLSGDQNWRPTGRMRGSLSGQAYSDALNQYIIRPTQQAQAARSPTAISPQLQTIIAKRATPTPPVTNQPSTTPDVSAVLPECSSAMQ